MRRSTSGHRVFKQSIPWLFAQQHRRASCFFFSTSQKSSVTDTEGRPKRVTLTKTHNKLRSSFAMEPKVLVFGTGSVGIVYAYIEANVVCICRSNFKAASENGFTINSSIFGNKLQFRPQIVQSISDAASHGPYSHVVVATKALPATPSFAEQLKPNVNPDTTIALLQNGIAVEREYSRTFPENPLLSCVVYLPVTQTSPAEVSHKEVERLEIGTYPSKASASHKAAAEAFADLIRKGGATAEIHDDVQYPRWSKLMVNAAWNPICALSRSSDAYVIQSSPQSVEYIRAVMTEISSIAEAVGYKEGWKELVDWQIGRATARKLPGVQPSMLADALAGRQLEVDAIVGNALQIAEERGVSTPLLRGIYVQAKALDESLQRARSTQG